MGSHGDIPPASSSSREQPEGTPQYWLRDNFVLTNDKSYVDLKVLNDTFGSEIMWWNDKLKDHEMRKMLDNCMTFAVCAVDQTEEQMKANGVPSPSPSLPLKMVGFGRVVTDYATFAYVTDVFVTKDYQRQGLASWMMRAVRDITDTWPYLRSIMLMTTDQATARMYERELGVVPFDKGPSAGLVLLEKGGRGMKEVPENH